ncbi:hypothetical protein T03_18132 [Trichinella britovi]|uniref:Uncharacterized protein n=1 Tax=Trichinella britovi TaxID=45882 RepID=A0A0V1C8L7_TRIBR|nr:hypothetical protein T03_18132 [Trichinella britovi]
MEMKIDSNLSVHERTSRFRSDVKIENKNENNNTDERVSELSAQQHFTSCFISVLLLTPVLIIAESISVSISCSSPSSPESHIHEILIPVIHQRTGRFRSDILNFLFNKIYEGKQ